jgi:pyruvate formate lyase activating enzyme
MHLAHYYKKLEESAVQCTLCPHKCKLLPGQTGICHVRSNRQGELQTENYGKVSALHLDPIEKKPFYRFFPGSYILSLGTVGCNLQCQFCQNCEISQTGINDFPWAKDYTPDEIVKKALEISNNIGIAFTYNEPTVFYEYMLDIAKISKNRGLKNVVVSNGYINKSPLKELLPWIDAFNIDLKAFTNEFYKKQTHSQIQPVKDTLVAIRNSGKHLEITNLIIPGLNDDEQEFTEMVEWISTQLGKESILHLSRYFPRYKMAIPSTSETVLRKLYSIAKSHLKYVYIGNI